jgi:hypothetical protein
MSRLLLSDLSLSLSLSLSSTLFSSMLWSITMDPNSLNKIAAGLDWKSVKFFLSHDQGFVFQIPRAAPVERIPRIHSSIKEKTIILTTAHES